MSTVRQAQQEDILRRADARVQRAAEAVRDERAWIRDHGYTRTGYIRTYGSEHDSSHHGDGGEAIYDADLEALQQAETVLAAAEYAKGQLEASFAPAKEIFSVVVEVPALSIEDAWSIIDDALADAIDAAEGDEDLEQALRDSSVKRVKLGAL